MPTPKIKIKRGILNPTATNLTSAGELAVNTNNKRFFIKTADDTTTTPVWMGAEIEATLSSPADSGKLTTQKGIVDYINDRVTAGTLGNVTLSTAQTITGAKTFQSNNVILDGVSLVFEESGANDQAAITLPSGGLSNGYTLRLPSTNPADTSKVLGVSSVDGTDAQLHWVDQTPTVTITEINTSSPDRAIVLTDGTNFYKDQSSGLLPTNGPLLYNKATGSIKLNGNLLVNGSIADVNVTPTANLSQGATQIPVTSTTGLQVGATVTINPNSAAASNGVALPAGTTITGLTSTQITLSNGVSAAVTGVVNLASMFTVANSGSVSVGPESSLEIQQGKLFDNVVNITVGSTSGDSVTLGKIISTTNTGSTLNIRASSGTSTLTTSGTTANLVNTGATTVNLGGAATALAIGGASGATTNFANSAGTSTLNISTNAISTGTKTINIGTGGTAGTTTINMGTTASGASIVLNGPVTNQAGTSPSSNDQVVTKSYVDSVAITGLTPKAPVDAASTQRLGAISGVSAVTFSAGTNAITWTGTSAATAGFLDTGVTLVANTTEASASRVLIKNEGDTNGIGAQYNGIYWVYGTNELRRTTDADANTELPKTTYVYVESGTSNGGKSFITNAAVATLNTTAITFSTFTSTTAFTFTDGLSVSGTNAVSVNPTANGGISVTSSGVALSSTVAGSGLALNSGVLTVNGQTTVATTLTTNFACTELSGVLTASANGLSTFNGVSLNSTTIRVLLTGQNLPHQNGIYRVSQIGTSSLPTTLTRAVDANTGPLILSNRRVFDSNTSRIYVLENINAPTLGTDAINYIGDSFFEGASFTPERYSLIGSPSDLTTALTAKSYTIIGTFTGTSVNANSTIGINVGASSSTSRPVLDALRPGMRLTSYTTTPTYISDQLIIDRIDRVSNQKVIYLRNMGTATISSLSSATNIPFTFDGSSSGTENSYANTGHKGILVYKDKDMFDCSILGYDTSANYWSYYTLGQNGTSTAYRLATTNNTETLSNKTLELPILNGGTINSNVLTTNVDNDIVTGKGIYTYKYGALNTTTKYRQQTLKQDVISLSMTSVSSNAIGYVANSQYGSIRTGTKITIEAQGTWTGVANNTVYYAVFDTVSSIKLANSYQNATAATPITITVSNGTTSDVQASRIIVEDTSLQIGYNNLGSTGTIYLPSTTQNKYDKIFGHADEIASTSPQYVELTQILANAQASNGIVSFDLPNNANVQAYDLDTGRTVLNCILSAHTGATSSAIKSIVLTNGSSTAVVTFTGALSNEKTLTSADFIAMQLPSAVGNADQRTLLNGGHFRVISVNSVSGDTAVTVQLPSVATSNEAGTITPANINSSNYIPCVKNYEMYLIPSNTAFTGSIGGALNFVLSTLSPVGTSINGNQLVLSNATNIVTGTIRISNVYWTMFRPQRLMLGTDGLPLVGTGTGTNGASSSTSALRTLNSAILAVNYLPQSDADYQTYTGKRILLNTLIDCGTY